MGEVFKKRQINSPFGIFFQMSVFLVATFGLYKLAEMFFYSYTHYNMLEKPSFVGFENYSRIFKDEVIQKAFSNTVIMVFAVAVLLMFTAVLPAIFTARLKLPFGLGVMGAFSIISICTMFSNSFSLFFSGDSYGLLNSWLLSRSIISEPINFTQTHALLISVIVMWLYCLAPVFSITYIAARMKHSFLGTTIAVCSIPVLMYVGGNVASSVVGFPSINYSADWIYTIFKDYLSVRFDVGFAYAILSLGFIMLIGWCLVVCSTIFGIWVLCKNVNSNCRGFKIVGYITFALSLMLFLTVFYFLMLYLLRAFMPLDEIFTYPSIYMPKKPTLDNFSNLADVSGSFVPFSRYLLNSLFTVPLMVMPVCFLVALPSGVGFGAFKSQKLLLLCFIPFLFISGYITFSDFGIINTYWVYMFEFLSSLELLITVFLVYLTVKLVFYDRKPRISGILLGSSFILTSFYAIGAIRGIWYTGNGAVYEEGLKIWKDIATGISAGGIARIGTIAANDMLMLITTLAVVIVPITLLLVLYLLYQKNTKNLCEGRV